MKVIDLDDQLLDPICQGDNRMSAKIVIYGNQFSQVVNRDGEPLNKREMKYIKLLCVVLIFISGFHSIVWSHPFLFSNNPHDQIFLIDTTLINQEMSKLMKDAQIPGCALAIIQERDESWIRCYGYRNLKKKLPVKTNTVFEAASLGKPVFTYLIFRLVEEDLIQLDRALMEYVHPDYIKRVFMRSSIWDERFQKITARMVLGHTTGLPNWRSAPDALTFITEPGKDFTYSGEGLLLLQRVIEFITGKDLNELMIEYVFKPLNMNNSSYVWKKSFVKQKAEGYDLFHHPSKKKVMKEAFAPYSLYTTVEDYARFIKAILRRYGLTDQSWNEIQKAHTSVPANQINRVAWGLGFGLAYVLQDTALWHWGDNGQFQNYMVIYPRRNIGLVFLTNSYYGLSIGREFVEKVLGITQTAFECELMTVYYHYQSKEMNFIRSLIKDGFEAAKLIDVTISHDILVEYGMHLMNKRKMNKAINVFRYVIEYYPDVPESYQNLGDIYRFREEYNRAIQFYQKALELRPLDPYLRNIIRHLGNFRN
jgi:CubicO group peptidase (beta-lactamase class C family)